VPACGSIAVAVWLLAARPLSVCIQREGAGAVAAKVEKKNLVGSWLHSHEEDTASTVVYRPMEYDFPPARGRRGYEFRADGSCNVIGISPRDGAARTSCTWKLHGGASSEILISFPDGRAESVPVVSVDSERLVVRKAGQ
jgi:hypothetical protein